MLLSRPFLVVCLLAIGLWALATGCKGAQSGNLSIGDNAPSFTLASYNGAQVALSDILEEKSALLYFHMGYG